MVDFAYGLSRPEDRRPTLARHSSNCLGTVAIVENLRAKGLTNSLTIKVYTDLCRVPSTYCGGTWMVWREQINVLKQKIVFSTMYAPMVELVDTLVLEASAQA